jgi:hypothetical protein
MARTPAKRRGISLAPNADPEGLADLFAGARAPAASPGPAQPPESTESRDADPGGGTAALRQEIAELRRLSSELDAGWRRQTDQMRQQVRTLEERRRASGRVGFLLGVLSLASVGALAYHAWPQVQGVAGDWKRLSAGAAQMAPELMAMRSHLDGVQSELSEIGGAIQSLQSDLSGVRADLGTLPERVAAAPAALTSPGHPGIARNATSLTNRYRTRYPGMPW